LDEKKPEDLATWFNTEVPEAMRPHYNETGEMVNKYLTDMGEGSEAFL
jgi:hypothetical protein